MHFFREMKWTPAVIIKWVVIAFVALIFASFVFSFVRHTLDSAPFGKTSAPGAMWRGVAEDDASPYYGGIGMGGGSISTMGLSARNAGGVMGTPSIAPMPPADGYTSGTTAEEYEVTEYSASIETQDKEKTCGQLSELKSRSYVIFESANEYDRGCDYRFKVEHARVQEILTFIEGLDPKDLNENTYTIKNLVDDFTSETEVLENKRRAIDDTLKEALAAYDDITELARGSGDASALAQVIDSKVQLIERLTQERINVNTQLDRLARAKAEQLDRLAYTYFNVSAYERRYLSGEDIKDSWKNALQATINDVNMIFQELTLGLITMLFFAAQWIIYILLAVFIGRYVWKWVRRIWKGEAPPATKSAAKNGSRGRARSLKAVSDEEMDNG